MIDRSAPARRPQGTPQGYHQWRSLLFMHWPIPAEQLQPHLPAELELDFFDGVAYVGIVPFAMQAVRPRWWPQRLGMRFLETNVRTYVVHRGHPGIFFFSLDAASRLAVWAARRFWGLPYFDAAMKLDRTGDEILYESQRDPNGPQHRTRCRIKEPLGSLDHNSIDYFFLERYLMFVEHRGELLAGPVHHTPYPAHGAEVLEIADDLLAAANLRPDQLEPEFAHFSPGVDVEVFGLRRLGEAGS